MSGQKVEHILVLMLENRSFDHLLGYLRYSAEVPFEGIAGREEDYPNPVTSGEKFYPGPNAGYLIDPGPGHSHADVLVQLLGPGDHQPPYHPTNTGFAGNYDEVYAHGHGLAALQCFPPERLPVLSQLAQEFAICDHWFCSVPGATWPNRNFAHAGHSAGEVNISARWYTDRTIFEQLEAAGRDWAVYYGGFPPQSIAFKNLWPRTANGRLRLQHFKPIRSLYRAIRQDRLPHYAFIEPDMLGKTSDSQHPGMGGEADFYAGERLIWRVYTALRQHPAVFRKTLLMITYDEHGGFFDHVPPPGGDEWAVEQEHKDPETGYRFRFDLLGPRVPAVLVSPWIERQTVDQTIYDHASIPASVRKILGVQAGPLSRRDAHANTFDSVLTRSTPRTILPNLAEPFVDESVRQLAEGLELRESLGTILRVLVWQRLEELLSPGPFGASGAAAANGKAEIAQAFGLEEEAGGLRVGAPGMEGEVGQAIPFDPFAGVREKILDELGPQLSAKAQVIVAEGEAEWSGEAALQAGNTRMGVVGVGNSLDYLLRYLRHKFERMITDLSLVDDAMLLVEWILRKFEAGGTILMDAHEGTRVNPTLLELDQALKALLATGQAQDRIWLVDQEERWVVIHGDGRAFFQDQRRAVPLRRGSVDASAALEMFSHLQKGEVDTLRAMFQRKVRRKPLDVRGER